MAVSADFVILANKCFIAINLRQMQRTMKYELLQLYYETDEETLITLQNDMFFAFLMYVLHDSYGLL